MFLSMHVCNAYTVCLRWHQPSICGIHMSEFSFDCCHLIYLITAACSDNFFYFGVVYSVFLPTSNICNYAFICDINQLFNNLMVGFVGMLLFCNMLLQCL